MREFYPLPETFDRGILVGDGRFRVETEPLPELENDDLLFRLITCGVSPRDLAGEFVNRTPPGVAVGEIAAVGEGVRGWNPLDRALLIPPAEETAAKPLPGLASYVCVPLDIFKAGAGIRLPQEIPAEDATLLPGAAIAVKLLREARVPLGGRLLVVGLGLIGQIVILLARHQKVDHIFGADRSTTLLRKAEWSGATGVISLERETLADGVRRRGDQRGFNAVVMLSPETSLIHDVFGVLDRRGVLILATPSSPSLMMAFSAARVQDRELRIQGVRYSQDEDLRDALQAVQLGVVNGETLVSKRVPWEELDGLELPPDYWEHGTHVVVEGPE